MSKCPITIACEQLKEGGFSSQDDAIDVNTVVIGGNTKAKYILDDVNYYISSRSIEVARFFVDYSHDQASESPEAFVVRMFAYTQFKVTREYVYLMIMRECTCIQLLARQLNRLSSAVIADIEQNAKSAPNNLISILSACNIIEKSINSLLYSPEILRTILGKLAEYAGIAPATLPRVDEPDERAFAQKPPVRGDFKSAHEFAKSAIAFEQETAKYAKKIEEYHCKMIEIINSILRSL